MAKRLVLYRFLPRHLLPKGPRTLDDVASAGGRAGEIVQSTRLATEKAFSGRAHSLRLFSFQTSRVDTFTSVLYSCDCSTIQSFDGTLARDIARGVEKHSLVHPLDCPGRSPR
jgi:hypothetical protein